MVTRELDGVAIVRDGVRIITSQALATVAALDATLRYRCDRALRAAGCPTSADLRRLTARLAALHTATDRLLSEDLR